MRIIAVANQKGGCGKTTVSINLAACLAEAGFRTLLVDMDPQGHCAVGLGVPEEQVRHSAWQLLTATGTGAEAPRRPLAEMVWQIGDNFDLLPASLELARFESATVGQGGRENRLREALAEADGAYDFAIVDCPPSLGLLTFNALCAADEVLIPVEAGFFALHGLSRQLEIIENLQVVTRRPLGVRVLCNLYDVRTRSARRIVAQLREHFADVLAETVVNFNARLKAAAEVGQPITEFDRSSAGFADFKALAAELANRPAVVEPLAQTAELLEQADSISRQAGELLAESARLVAGSVADRLDAADPLAVLDGPTVDQKLEQFYGARQSDDGVEFAVSAPDAERVCVAGDFNDWSPHATPLARRGGDGRWAVRLPLGAGLHRYRLVIDGRWDHDPNNSYREANPYGELNSVIEVK